MLSSDQIQKFQAIYKNRFGRLLTEKEACEKGSRLIRLMEIIYRPMTEAEYKLLQKRRREKSGL